MNRHALLTVIVLASFTPDLIWAEPPEGFVSLYDGKTFAGWTVPKGDNGHWRIVDGVIDYDASSESPEDKNLWSEKEYANFVLLAGLAHLN